MKIVKYVAEDNPERKMAIVYPFLNPKDEESDNDLCIEADELGVLVGDTDGWLSIPEADKLNAAIKAAIDYAKKLNKKTKGK